MGRWLGKRFYIPEWYTGALRVVGSAVQGAVGFSALDDVDWLCADLGLQVSTRSSVLRRGQAGLSCGWVPDMHGPACTAGGMGFVSCAGGTVRLLLLVGCVQVLVCNLVQAVVGCRCRVQSAEFT